MTVDPLWTPPDARVRSANLTRFIRGLNVRNGLDISTFDDLHAFSLERPDVFWTEVWDQFGIIAETRGAIAVEEGVSMPAARFFPGARLSYAENVLRAGPEDKEALVFRGEDKVRLSMTRGELRRRVAKIARLLSASGIAAGDRVCAVVPNHPDSIAAFLAVNAVGAIWSSCSPDFGERGILDRFGQIAPRALICCDGYFYNGRLIDLGPKIAAVLARLPDVRHVFVIDYVGTAERSPIPGARTLDEATEGLSDAPLDYARLPFDHPLYVLYSSGTTGVPKCIVHRAGGILIKHLTEHLLHTDLKPDDRLFYFTTCGWMMWNWLVSGLYAGGTLLLYDGSPFHPNERAIFDFAQEEGMTILGTSAKYIDAVRKTGLRPRDTHDLSALRTICSTGSPLAPESFDFVYDAIKPGVHLASISGGTDICGHEAAADVGAA